MGDRHDEPDRELSPIDGGGGLLPSSHGEVGKDMQLLGRAIKEGWNIPEPVKVRAVACIHQILGEDVFEMEATTVRAGGGDDGKSGNETKRIRMPNHRNQIAAANVLAKMTAQNQADRHLQSKYDRLDNGQATENIAHAVIIKGISEGDV